MKIKKSQKGVSLVEVVVASSIILIFVVSIHLTFGTVVKAAFSNTKQLQAAFLAEEGIEAVKSIRDYGWNVNFGTINHEQIYYLAWSSGRWTLSTTPSLIDQRFSRTLAFSSVYRDASDNIVTNGGTLDTNSKKVTVRVSWSDGISNVTKTIEAYFSNVFSN